MMSRDARDASFVTAGGPESQYARAMGRTTTVAALVLALAACDVARAQDALFADSYEPPPPGGSTVVATPQLVATLRDQFHESWLASPAVADLDGNGSIEIIAPRSSVVVGWHLDGQVVFRTTVMGSRVWASPVVADLVAASPGLEVAVAARDRIYVWNAAGTLLNGFPHVARDEMRSLAAGDIDGNGDLELVAVTTTRLEANGQRDILVAIHHDGTPVAGFPRTRAEPRVAPRPVS